MKLNNKNSIKSLKKIISIYEGNIAIPPETHNEYISFHNIISLDNYTYEEVVKMSLDNLFNEKSAWTVKKKLLFLLGELATPECFQIIKKYIDDPKTKRKDWALLSLQELCFHIENEVYEEVRNMIMSPIGGKGNMLRYYVVLSKKHGEVFTKEEKEIIKIELEIIAKRMESETEEFKFGKSYVLIKILTSINVASGDVIDTLLDICSTEKNILRYHYFMINTKKPNKKEIKEYLEMDEVASL